MSAEQGSVAALAVVAAGAALLRKRGGKQPAEVSLTSQEKHKQKEEHKQEEKQFLKEKQQFKQEGLKQEYNKESYTHD